MKWTQFLVLILAVLFSITRSSAQPNLLDNFESSTAWLPFASDGVKIDTSIVAGYSGNCLKIDFGFTTGAG
jgi:hypothetical protein